MSASLVEYEGFLASGAATLTPALHFNARGYSLGVQGNWTVFESGNQILQVTAAAARLARLSQRWRLELGSSAGAARYGDAPGSAHVLGRARLHFATPRAGAWFSASSGSLSDADGMPVEVALGAWSVHNRFALMGTVTQAWLGSARHLDVVGAVRWTGERLELEARAGARPWTVSSGDIGEAVTGAHGELSALVALHQRVALALSAGSYPADPVRRVLGARYITAGLRLSTAGASESRQPLVALNTSTTERSDTAIKEGTPASIEIVSAGRMHALRVHAPAATSVEVMGDFTDWQPLQLTKTGASLWEARLQLTPGIHRLNVRIDRGEWIVPAGARSEAGDFGPAVGVILIR